MPWKKAWPSNVKKELKEKGMKDKDIETLESYGSIAELKKDPKKALKSAKAEEVTDILKHAGLF